MNWCESNGLYFVIGLSKNSTLIGRSEVALMLAQWAWAVTGKTGRAFSDFMYKTKDSGSRERRVICRMEYNGSKPEGRESNPRYIVTNLPSEEHNMRDTYEKMYCARGDMENRIKEHQSEQVRFTLKSALKLEQTLERGSLMSEKLLQVKRELSEREIMFLFMQR